MFEDLFIIGIFYVCISIPVLLIGITEREA